MKQYVSIGLGTIATLAPGNANVGSIVYLITPVLEQVGWGWLAIWQGWESGSPGIGGAYIVKVISGSKAVTNLGKHINFFAKGVFDAHRQGKTNSHRSVRFSIRVQRTPLSFGP